MKYLQVPRPALARSTYTQHNMGSELYCKFHSFPSLVSALPFSLYKSLFAEWNQFLFCPTGRWWVHIGNSISSNSDRAAQSRVFIPRAPFLKNTKTSKCIRNNKKRHSSVWLVGITWPAPPRITNLSIGAAWTSSLNAEPVEDYGREPWVLCWACTASRTIFIRPFIGHHLTFAPESTQP